MMAATAVVIPIMTQHYPMLQRNLLYTGVTIFDHSRRTGGAAPVWHGANLAAPRGMKSCRRENDYEKEVYNGDIGYIDDVDPSTSEVAVRFDGRTVNYGFGELDALVPAFATTIHQEPGFRIPGAVRFLGDGSESL
jgi:hypothetical protein